MPTDHPNARVHTRRQQIGTSIRTARLHANLTQEQLSDQSALDVKTIGRIEHAVTDPSLSTLIRIADAIGVPLSDLVRE